MEPRDAVEASNRTLSRSAVNRMPGGTLEPNLLLKAKPNAGGSNPSSKRHLDGMEIEEEESSGFKKTKRMS